MISELELPAYLQTKLPEMKEALVKKEMTTARFGPMESIQCLADFTMRNASLHNSSMLKRCFSVAGRLYTTGSHNVKHAMEAVYIHSFSLLFATCNALEKRTLQTLMPAHLYSAYVRQIMKSNY